MRSAFPGLKYETWGPAIFENQGVSDLAPGPSQQLHFLPPYSPGAGAAWRRDRELEANVRDYRQHSSNDGRANLKTAAGEEERGESLIDSIRMGSAVSVVDARGGAAETRGERYGVGTRRSSRETDFRLDGCRPQSSRGGTKGSHRNGTGIETQGGNALFTGTAVDGRDRQRCAFCSSADAAESEVGYHRSPFARSRYRGKFHALRGS
jgi:hypothetical protein